MGTAPDAQSFIVSPMNLFLPQNHIHLQEESPGGCGAFNYDQFYYLASRPGANDALRDLGFWWHDGRGRKAFLSDMKQPDVHQSN